MTETLTQTLDRPARKDRPTRDEQVTAARQFAVDAARLAADTRCHSVKILDVSRLSGMCDFFVLATGTSPRQLRSVGLDLEELAAEREFPMLSASGRGNEVWVALDFVDVVVHLLSPDARDFYDLDGLWGDAPEVDWQRESDRRGAVE